MEIIKDRKSIASYLGNELMPQCGYCTYGRKVKIPTLIVKSEENNHELFETES